MGIESGQVKRDWVVKLPQDGISLRIEIISPVVKRDRNALLRQIIRVQAFERFSERQHSDFLSSSMRVLNTSGDMTCV